MLVILVPLEVDARVGVHGFKTKLDEEWVNGLMPCAACLLEAIQVFEEKVLRGLGSPRPELQTTTEKIYFNTCQGWRKLL